MRRPSRWSGPHSATARPGAATASGGRGSGLSTRTCTRRAPAPDTRRARSEAPRAPGSAGVSRADRAVASAPGGGRGRPGTRARRRSPRRGRRSTMSLGDDQLDAGAREPTRSEQPVEQAGRLAFAHRPWRTTQRTDRAPSAGEFASSLHRAFAFEDTSVSRVAGEHRLDAGGRLASAQKPTLRDQPAAIADVLQAGGRGPSQRLAVRQRRSVVAPPQELVVRARPRPGALSGRPVERSAVRLGLAVLVEPVGVDEAGEVVVGSSRIATWNALRTHGRPAAGRGASLIDGPTDPRVRTRRSLVPLAPASRVSRAAFLLHRFCAAGPG